MKVFSFFNSKGGVGKSLHTVMFASWLAYHEGARVAVADFENPVPRIRQIRESEEISLQDPSSALYRFLEKNPVSIRPYDVMEFMDPTKGYDEAFLKALVSKTWQFYHDRDKDYDYVLFDFPATFVDKSPAFVLICSGIVDLVAVPIEVDNMTRKEGLLTSLLIKRNEQNVVVFWNNVSGEDLKRPGYLDSGEWVFLSRGVDVLPQRIKSFQKAKRDSDERLFVKSTVCWPQRYVEMSCPTVVDLYRELKGRLDSIQ